MLTLKAQYKQLTGLNHAFVSKKEEITPKGDNTEEVEVSKKNKEKRAKKSAEKAAKEEMK